MEISDLVVIGRLGRLEPDGFYHIQLSQPYKPIVNQIQQCFLIFSSNRVFFVTVVETKTVGSRDYVRFLEDGVAEECKTTSKITVAMTEEDLMEFEDEDDVTNLFGYKVHFNDAIIGEVTDAMINPMQSVLIIALEDGSELLVPDVDYYIEAVNNTDKIIYMQNLELLLEVCTSKS
jgi:ribosomal 30S subunit maturation factor RimM